MLCVLFALLIAETQASDFAENKQEDFKIGKEANNKQISTHYETYDTQESGVSRGLFKNKFKINDNEYEFTDDDNTISNDSPSPYVDSDFSNLNDINVPSNLNYSSSRESEEAHSKQDTQHILDDETIRNHLTDEGIEKDKISNTMYHYLNKNGLATGGNRSDKEKKVKIKKIIKTPKQLHTEDINTGNKNIYDENKRNTYIKRNLKQISDLSDSDNISFQENNLEKGILNSKLSDIASISSSNQQNQSESKKYKNNRAKDSNNEHVNSANDITHLIEPNDAESNTETIKAENIKKNDSIGINKSNKLKIEAEKQNDWYALNNKLDSMKNKKVQVEIPMTSTLLKDVIAYVQAQIEQDEKRNKVKDNNFDIIRASQEEIIGIIGNYENNNIVFNDITKVIATIKTIIDFYTTISQENKKLNDKLSQITKHIANRYTSSVDKLFKQFQSNAYILNLIKLIFASDNGFLKSVQLQPSSKYLSGESAKNLIENYLKGVYPITSSNEEEIYEKFLEELTAKLRTSIDILPTKFIFTLCQVLMDFSNEYSSQLATANTDFKGECAIFKQKIAELPLVTASVDVKFVAKLKMYVSELEKYQNEVSSKTDNIINLMQEIMNVLSQKFNSYVPDNKILALNTN